MISQKMMAMAKNNSVVRQMFEEGKQMAAKYGAKNVFDFSLGNPNVPTPSAVEVAMFDALNEEDSTVLHGYMSNAGYEDVRQAVADSLNRRFGTNFGQNNIIMSVGAAGALNVALKTLIDPGDEVICIAPYFLEYRNYVANYDGVVVEVSANPPSFQPNLDEFAAKITAKTKAVLVNNPNNPSGAVYTEETIKKMGEILVAKEKEFGTSIYIVSDEPYRELAYDGVKVPFITKYYHNTIVGYSFSKSLSLPGERIGYLVIPSELDDYEITFEAASIATRILGYVNAPSLLQKAIGRCVDTATDISFYDKNRKTLYEGLTKCGFECAKPEGAFYLFMKTPIDDDKAFSQAAKKYNLLLVPGSSFACPGYVRIAYCVSYETIVNSLPKFEELASEFGLK